MSGMNRMLWRSGALGLACAAVLAVAAPVAAQDAPKKHPGVRAGAAFNLGASNTYLLNFNEWLCGLHQIGEVCTSAVGSSVGGGGFWPAGTANQYIFNSGLQMAGVIGPEGGPWAGDTVSTFFFNASGPGHGSPVSPVYVSNNPADLAAWPEDCYIDSPTFGRLASISELDTCVQYWDADPSAAFPGSHPMGILVTQHSMLWSFPATKDIIFFSYKFKNASNDPGFRSRNPSVPAGGYTLTDLYAAFAMDPDVSGSEYSQNYASVVPELNMAMSWQYDFEAADFVPFAPNFDAAPGFVGVKYLQSPLNTADSAITVRVGNQTRVVEPGEELGLTYFSVFTNPGASAPMPDADNADQAFRYLSGQLTAEERSNWCGTAPAGMCYVNLAGPADMRFYQSSGPFSLAPGEEAEIVVAYIAGAPVPGTYVKGTVVPIGQVTDTTRQIEAIMGRGYDVPGFPSLFANARTAQAIFDIDFVQPSAPSAPTVTAIPGDRQVTVVWTDDPVDDEDLYATAAADPESDLYDPNFRAQDFEGFRVYRRTSPSAPWQIIAQFDLANSLSERVTVLQEVETASGDVLIIEADTARVCPSSIPGCTAETGLKFSLVDRGGEFPDPASGPGLVNGVRYYYAVTSFDINSPAASPSTLESVRRLTNNPQDQGAASAVPRPDAADFVAGGFSLALQGSDGTDLDPDAAMPDLDPETATFDGPMPATDGLDVVLGAFIPQLVTEAGEATVTIDSVFPGNPAHGDPALYHITVEAPAGTQQITVPLAISFTSGDYFEASAVATLLRGDAEFGSAFGLADGERVTMGAEIVVASPANYFLTGIGRGWVNGAGPSQKNGPRWFMTGQSEPANPNNAMGEWWDEVDYAGLFAGDVDNFEVYPIKGYFTASSRLRELEGILSTVRRAADIEVTWGANGQVQSVRDVTHNVDVPFHEAYRASYGFLSPASFAGTNESATRDGDNAVITASDWWCVSPAAEWVAAGEIGFGADCSSPAVLQASAALSPIGGDYGPGGSTYDATSPTQQGFAMYINGEIFFFFGNALPAAGTTWTLRTYAGYVEDTDDGYGFVSMVRPPAVPGLQAVMTLDPSQRVPVTAATLATVHTVPDPYYVTSSLETSSLQKRLQFVNLPQQAVIRIFTTSGVLVAAIQHNSAAGSSTAEWDLRNRNNQFVASGVYFYHVETPDGNEKVGKFTVVQYAQ